MDVLRTRPQHVLGRDATRPSAETVQRGRQHRHLREPAAVVCTPPARVVAAAGPELARFVGRSSTRCNCAGDQRVRPHVQTVQRSMHADSIGRAGAESGSQWPARRRSEGMIVGLQGRAGGRQGAADATPWRGRSPGSCWVVAQRVPGAISSKPWARSSANRQGTLAIELHEPGQVRRRPCVDSGRARVAMIGAPSVRILGADREAQRLERAPPTEDETRDASERLDEGRAGLCAPTERPITPPRAAP